jgi:GT2 family glycosyltransferase
MASVEVIIVNYRNPQLTIDCLESLEAIQNEVDRLHVSLVDNCSPDNSIEQLQSVCSERGWQDWIEIIPSGRNGGFAYGNNVALRKVLNGSNQPEYFWLLNPDTLVRSGSLRSLVQFLQENDDTGIVGSHLVWPNGEYPTSVFRFFSILGELERGFAFGPVTRMLNRFRLVPEQPKVDAKADWVPGASMLIRTSTFETIGLLDESFFMYFEETDFCLRARRAGIHCGFAAGSSVVHLEGQSSGIRQEKEQRAKRLPQYWFDSRQRYFRKNYGRGYALAIDSVWCLALIAKRLRQFVLCKPNLDPPGLIQATWASIFRPLKN